MYIYIYICIYKYKYMKDLSAKPAQIDMCAFA